VGKRKLVRLLRREGFAVSLSTLGRILKHLVDRGMVTPVQADVGRVLVDAAPALGPQQPACKLTSP